MTNSWIRAQDRKRNLVAAASTACLYLLAFVGAWAIGLLAPVSLASTPGTVIVDLGGMEGPPGQVPLGLPNAPDRPFGEPAGAAPLPAAGGEIAPQAAQAPEKPSSPSSTVASIPAPKATAKTVAKPETKAPPAKAATKALSTAAAKTVAAKTVPAKDEAAAAKEAAAQAAAEAQAAQEAAALRAAEATAQAAAAPPKTRTFGSGSSSKSGAPVTSTGTGSGPGVAGGTGTATFRGSEMGSALTTTFGASTGQVGRNIYVPIYLYMPLPSHIDDSIYKNIAAKETFKHFYQSTGSGWQLTSQAPLAQRGDFWTMLEAAGYDASTADYKTSRKLSPVVLEFAVGPLSKNRVELVDVRLQSSSGSPEIDEAVIYGFRQASFFNKTGYAVGGKFVYQF
jgi:outer membrane biosynthesis protein TonB